jgi:putative ABC transport system substrate-binding protein
VKETKGVPIVAALLTTSEEIKASASATGVLLDFPLETQLQWISRVLPECRNIGVIYCPRKNQQKIDTAMRVAQGMGLKLHARKVETPADLPDALEYLAKRVDVLWGLPDELTFTPQTAKQILLFSFRNRIPLVGPSESWVKAGALFSLEWDYRDIGIQCAEMVVKVRQGTQAASIPPAWPRKIMYAINAKTALHMKTEIPEPLINGSHQVFR